MHLVVFALLFLLFSVMLLPVGYLSHLIIKLRLAMSLSRQNEHWMRVRVQTRRTKRVLLEVVGFLLYGPFLYLYLSVADTCKFVAVCLATEEDSSLYKSYKHRETGFLKESELKRLELKFAEMKSKKEEHQAYVERLKISERATLMGLDCFLPPHHL